jgi:saccharopine dehydrogenase-like NADP-dependent oxidoreductase
MKIIDEIQAEGGKITGFKSHCGGLVAPESDTNPWGYKFTWNPKNVVLAGTGTASFYENGMVKHLPYSKLYSRIEHINIPSLGMYDGYANRDSTAYMEIYGLKDVQTLVRGTLRKSGYCAAWDVFVQLGMTDDNLTLHDASKITFPELLERFLPAGEGHLNERLAKYIGVNYNNQIEAGLRWLGAFTGTEGLGVETLSAADALLIFLQRKWVLEPHDKDMIVMQHQFEYIDAEGVTKKKSSSLVVKGKDQHHTAMAQTVGLPLGIACRMVLEGRVEDAGVIVPVQAKWYELILAELEQHGVVFMES